MKDKKMLEQRIEELYQAEKKEYSKEDLALFEEFIENLNLGKIRAIRKEGNDWKTNFWVKKGILLGFKMGKIVEMPLSKEKIFIDKNTFPERKFGLQDKVRIVPGGSSVRNGAYLAANVTIMPPAFVNVGAYVDEGTMVDSHVTVGSCAQVGKRVHLSACVQIGGVLEPIGANSVIIEDDVFIGGNSGIYEGVIVRKRAVIASGVIITRGTPIYDNVKGEFLPQGEIPQVPENAVVVSGARRLKNNPDISVYCPVIIKYRDEKSDKSITLEDILR